ncbi:MAG TPA: PIN domain-containing protein [Polyangia bacterium]|nr:PIN domain-containing protein [Polyangia bacterium]
MIIADTGFFLALGNTRDDDHARAKRALENVTESLVTTWPIVTETCHLLAHRLGAGAVDRFIAGATRRAFELFDLEVDHLPRIAELMRKYRDLPMDLADASLVILAEHLGSGRILSTDRRDFGAYRWKNRRPFHNLLA